MTSVESAVPAKTPEPDQYWEHVKSKDRVYFIGRNPEGEMVWQCEGDAVEVGNLDWSGWRHIPGCTGWDWEPDQVEEFPQYWTTLSTPSSSIAYIKRIDQSTLVSVCKDGTEIADSVIEWKTDRRARLTEQEALALLDKPVPAEKWPQYYINRDPGCNWYVRAENHRTIPNVYLPDGSIVTSQANWDDIESSLSRGIWVEVTEAEARARIGYVPVAPEMDWVVQDRVPARNNIDEWCWCRADRKPKTFQHGFAGWSSGIMHGHRMGDEVLHLRCRRKDLPDIESPEDWVTQDRVEARPGIDQGWWSYAEPNVDKSKWSWWPIANSGSAIGRKHGHVHEDGQMLNLRCKRKDLPPVPAPVEETFPQWYILKESEIRSWVPRWAIKRTGEETAIRYAFDGGEELSAANETWYGGTDAWRKCNPAEAFERLGILVEEHLPAVPSDKRRVPVKLWVTYRLNDEGGDWPVRATQADQTCQNWKEIKFDGNGAFIEVEQ